MASREKATKAKTGQMPDRSENDVRYPPGHWMGLGIAMGIPLGIPIGILAGIPIDDIGLGMTIGPAFGVAIGTGIGWMLERMHKGQIRHYTPSEEGITIKLSLIGIGALIIGLLMFLWNFF
jgi:hypothetical protein